MGKSRSIIMFIFAIIVAFFFTVLTFNWLQKLKKQKPEVTPVVEEKLETQQIAVATLDLSWGTSINQEMIKMAPFLLESLPSGTFDDSSKLIGRTLLYPIKTGEPVLEAKLAPITLQTGGVAAVITQKKRAMSVKVDKVSGVSGFIHPGHRVDVLVTLRSAGKGRGKGAITKTVLENILVLAAGTEMERVEQIDQKEKKTAKVDVITLEVTPEEGEKLALAATQGRLLLALRNFADSEDVITEGMTIPVLLSSYTRSSPEGRKKRPKKKRVQPRRSVSYVELIKGNKVTKLRFKNGTRY